MSYCRFIEADIYLFWSSTGGIECCACLLRGRKRGSLFPESQIFETFKAALEHVADHRDAGHHVPLDVDARIIEDALEHGPKVPRNKAHITKGTRGFRNALTRRIRKRPTTRPSRALRGPSSR